MRVIRAISTLAAWGIAGTVAAQAPAGRLEFADAIRMTNCEPAAEAPCFRVRLKMLDAQGNPLNAQLPPPERLADQIAIRVDGRDIKPFFAAAEGGVEQAARGRTALVLIDISGSMNRVLPTGGTRFEAAKGALTRFVDSFQDGADRVAIVPFESHRVETTIRSARFASTKADALQQIDALQAPKPSNNTALFSAVVAGLDVLEQQANNGGAGASAAETMLLVMTDGSNDVESGDDLGLLAGKSGEQRATASVQAAQASGIQVYAVGFGDPKDIDQDALQHLSTRWYMPDSAEELKKVFTFERKLFNNRIRAAFASPYPDRSSLAGRTMLVSARLTLSDGQVLTSGERTWDAPELGVPLFAARCDEAEMKPLIAAAVPGLGWMPVLRPALVFLGLGALLLVLWFWIPSLAWPDRYVGVAPNRWAEAGKTFSVRAGPPPPPGFETARNNMRPPPRGAADPTVVQPRPDFSNTRLQLRPDQEEKH